MLRSALLFSIVLHVLAPSSAVAALLRMESARVTSAKSESELGRLCGVNRPIDACTTFPDFQLSATCRADGQQWALTTSARIAPFMVLFASDAMKHEFIHINDVQGATLRYLRDLERKRYMAQQDCETVAAVETVNFGLLVKSFADQSNVARHPGKGRGPR